MTRFREWVDENLADDPEGAVSLVFWICFGLYCAYWAFLC